MTTYINGQDQTGRRYSTVEKTTDYTLTLSDLGSSIRVTAASGTTTMSFPSVGSTEDGSKITFNKTGAGGLVVLAADSDLIADSSAGGTIFNSSKEIDATLSLEYVHGIVTWVVKSAKGTWTTT